MDPGWLLAVEIESEMKSTLNVTRSVFCRVSFHVVKKTQVGFFLFHYILSGLSL